MPEPAYPTYVVEQSEYETEPVLVVSPPGEGSRIITDGQASPTVVIGNREEKTGPPDAGRACGVRNIASNVLCRATIATTGAQTAAGTT